MIASVSIGEPRVSFHVLALFYSFLSHARVQLLIITASKCKYNGLHRSGFLNLFVKFNYIELAETLTLICYLHKQDLLPVKIFSVCLAHPDLLRVQSSSPVCGESSQAIVIMHQLSPATLDTLVACLNVRLD